jgi:hypothetical protein
MAKHRELMSQYQIYASLDVCDPASSAIQPNIADSPTFHFVRSSQPPVSQGHINHAYGDSGSVVRSPASARSIAAMACPRS